MIILKPYGVRIGWIYHTPGFSSASSSCHLCISPWNQISKSPGETVSLLVNTSMPVQNAQQVLVTSSSFCFHELGVPGMFGTLQECLGKSANSTGRQRSGLSTKEHGAVFPNPRFACGSYLSYTGRAGFHVAMEM